MFLFFQYTFTYLDVGWKGLRQGKEWRREKPFSKDERAAIGVREASTCLTLMTIEVQFSVVIWISARSNPDILFFISTFSTKRWTNDCTVVFRSFQRASVYMTYGEAVCASYQPFLKGLKPKPWKKEREGEKTSKGPQRKASSPFSKLSRHESLRLIPQSATEEKRKESLNPNRICTNPLEIRRDDSPLCMTFSGTRKEMR